jgi:F-box interacting protein
MLAASTTRSRFINYYDVVAHGFAYDSQNNDFKILRIMCYSKWSGPKAVQLAKAEVYTLSTDSWRRVVIPVGSLSGYIHNPQHKPCIFFNGALHSIAYINNHNFILCFDVNDERFREIMLPDNYLDGYSPDLCYFKQLVVIKGLLGLVVFHHLSDVCLIWVMREYGVVESWTQRIESVDLGGRFYGCTDSGELLIGRIDSGLVSLDPDSLNEKNLGIGIQRPRSLRYTTDFMENLVLVDGVN